MFKNKLSAVMALGFVSVLPGLALATGPTAIDVSEATAQLETIGTTVLAVGGALLVAAAIAVAVKWAKAAIFG
jgi:hypothetical protein